MDSCDRRVRAYKNGKTFDQCRDMAESMNPNFKKQIEAGVHGLVVCGSGLASILVLSRAR